MPPKGSKSSIPKRTLESKTPPKKLTKRRVDTNTTSRAADDITPPSSRVSELGGDSAKDNKVKEGAVKEGASKGHAIKDDIVKNHTAKDDAATSHLVNDDVATSHLVNDDAATSHPVNDDAVKDHAVRNYAAKDSAAKDSAAKDSAAKDSAAKHGAAKHSAVTGDARQSEPYRGVSETSRGTTQIVRRMSGRVFRPEGDHMKGEYIEGKSRDAESKDLLPTANLNGGNTRYRSQTHANASTLNSISESKVRSRNQPRPQGLVKTVFNEDSKLLSVKEEGIYDAGNNLEGKAQRFSFIPKSESSKERALAPKRYLGTVPKEDLMESHTPVVPMLQKEIFRKSLSPKKYKSQSAAFTTKQLKHFGDSFEFEKEIQPILERNSVSQKGFDIKLPTITGKQLVRDPAEYKHQVAPKVLPQFAQHQSLSTSGNQAELATDFSESKGNAEVGPKSTLSFQESFQRQSRTTTSKDAKLVTDPIKSEGEGDSAPEKASVFQESPHHQALIATVNQAEPVVELNGPKSEDKSHEETSVVQEPIDVKSPLSTKAMEIVESIVKPRSEGETDSKENLALGSIQNGFSIIATRRSEGSVTETIESDSTGNTPRAKEKSISEELTETPSPTVTSSVEPKSKFRNEAQVEPKAAVEEVQTQVHAPVQIKEKTIDPLATIKNRDGRDFWADNSSADTYGKTVRKGRVSGRVSNMVAKFENIGSPKSGEKHSFATKHSPGLKSSPTSKTFWDVKSPMAFKK